MTAVDQGLLPRIPRREMPQGFVEIKNKLAPLARLEPGRTFMAIFATWFVIAAAITCWYVFQSLWLLPLLILIIGAMQHALAILAHEGVHGTIMKNRKWNQRIGSWFCAWPVSMNFEDFRYVHLQHHRHANDDSKDPDWIYFKDWHDMPKSRGWILKFILKYLVGYGFIDAFRYKINMHQMNPNRRLITGDQFIIFLAALLIGIGAVYQIWWPFVDFLVLWIIPIHLVFYPMNLVRAMCEHYGMSRKPVPTQLDRMFQCRSVKAGFLERVFLAPFNINYHLEHHLFDNIPYYNLPQASRLVRAVPEVAAQPLHFDSYTGMGGALRQLFSR